MIDAKTNTKPQRLNGTKLGDEINEVRAKLRALEAENKDLRDILDKV